MRVTDTLLPPLIPCYRHCAVKQLERPTLARLPNSCFLVWPSVGRKKRWADVRYSVGQKVIAKFRASSMGRVGRPGAWFSGTVATGRIGPLRMFGPGLYDIAYDDGDYEPDVDPHFMRPLSMESLSVRPPEDLNESDSE